MNKLVFALIPLLIGSLIGSMVTYYQVEPDQVSEQTSIQQSTSCKIGEDTSDLKQSLKNKTDLDDSEVQSALSYLKFKRIKESVMPSGSPDYAQRLGVSYNQADQAVNTLASLEREVRKEDLSSEEERYYIEIGTTEGTACEYCCGVKEGFARSNGQRSCGCAHNKAFSGLTMWMIKNGYSNQEILDEIAKWKASFFPKQVLTQKLQSMKKDDPEIKKLLKEFPTFLPQMVGGC